MSAAAGPLGWGALAAALVYLGVVATGARGPVRAVKVLPALLLAAAAAPELPLVALALLLSAAGDAFLLDKERFFLPGLVAFLLAHLAFVPAFLLASGRAPEPAFVAAILVPAAALLAVLRPRKPLLRVAVPVYALALVAMVAAASTLGPLGVAGGLAFLVSDATLAFRLFKREFPGSDLVVLITYYFALLALSVAVRAP